MYTLHLALVWHMLNCKIGDAHLIGQLSLVRKRDYKLYKTAGYMQWWALVIM